MDTLTCAQCAQCAREVAEIAYRLMRKDLLPNPHHQIMRKMVDKTLEKHPLIFHSIKKKVTESDDFFPIFIEMYGDGKMNWGRLVATFAICCAVGTEEKAGALSKVLERFVKGDCNVVANGAPNLAQWILDNGGWDGFCLAFRPLVQKEKPTVWERVSFLLCRVHSVLNYF